MATSTDHSILTTRELTLALGGMTIDGFTEGGALRAANRVALHRTGYGPGNDGTTADVVRSIARLLATAYIGSGVLATW